MIQAVLLAAAMTTPDMTMQTITLSERSPAEIVCSLTGDCGGSPGGVRAPLPKEASFDLNGIADASLERQYAKLHAARLRIASTSRR